MLPTSHLKGGADYRLGSSWLVRWADQATFQLSSSSWFTWHVPYQQDALALHLDDLQSDTPVLLALVQGKQGPLLQQAEHLQPGGARGPAAQDASNSDIMKAAVRQALKVREQPASGPSADKGKRPAQVCSTHCRQVCAAKHVSTCAGICMGPHAVLACGQHAHASIVVCCLPGLHWLTGKCRMMWFPLKT